MTIVGVSGHQRLPDAARLHADRTIREILAAVPGSLVGLSSLAEGADQLFAEILVDLGGTLHAVVPAKGYDATFSGAALDRFQRLLSAADIVTVLDHPEPGEAAYDDAGKFVAENSELLIAVWDGQPARGLGGTADAVAHARRFDRQVVIVWPDGVQRS
ncbi:hypothetical protein [Kibdelosporangium aridum]|nr:hypothetical protein [Kibdelosporangium aridum]